MIRTAFLFLVLLLGVASPAFALKCLPPDVARDVRAAKSEQTEWIAVNGMLETGPVPRSSGEVPARFWGWALGRAGFDRPFDQRITLRVSCYGPWCGEARTGPMAALLKREEGRLVLIADPCNANRWPGPSARQVRALVKSCGAGCR
ncbi:hypothetical protein CEW88_12715 [Alloyangia pacifica]|uniref:Inhibitor of vertebrate lysozyme (Ivy) n=1 Tax=Alloyangia pacifica TaxID=311180 RepID=A0A2U8HFM2_9RHOB|nr:MULTISPECIES: hypothetical protein [Roseobacteraceae]AWI84470.1 hypothetical protein CEW88_12715 [Alloyangia pacifica]NDV54050.1 hypothetical protein [Salipiger sp. PrR003]NDW32222.1 hypothetical protein [Salipiger sp. PrR007]